VYKQNKASVGIKNFISQWKLKAEDQQHMLRGWKEHPRICE